MNDIDSIFAWICDLPDCSHVGPSKRKVVAGPSNKVRQLASPPASSEENEDENMASTPKRRRLGNSRVFDPDATPRPGISSPGSLSRFDFRGKLHEISQLINEKADDRPTAQRNRRGMQSA